MADQNTVTEKTIHEIVPRNPDAGFWMLAIGDTGDKARSYNAWRECAIVLWEAFKDEIPDLVPQDIGNLMDWHNSHEIFEAYRDSDYEAAGILEVADQDFWKKTNSDGITLRGVWFFKLIELQRNRGFIEGTVYLNGYESGPDFYC